MFRRVVLFRAAKLLFSAACLLAAAPLAQAGAPVALALIDWPVDYAHPAVRAAFDLDSQKALVYRRTDLGVDQSWYALNEESRRRFEASHDPALIQDALDYLSTGNRLRDATRATTDGERARYDRLARTYAENPGFWRTVAALPTYLHGTMIAGIMVRDLPDARLINFTRKRPPETSLGRELWSGTRTLGAKLREHYAELGRVLREREVRVANLSQGVSEELYFQALRAKEAPRDRIWPDWILRRHARKAARICREELARFVRDNPRTVFVIASGNDGLEVRESAYSFASLRAPNVLKVGSIDRELRKDPRSSYSADLVDYAASGVAVEGPRIGGGTYYGTGTSYAAPVVSNELGRVFSEGGSGLSVEEALRRLSSRARRDPELAKHFREGRYFAIP